MPTRYEKRTRSKQTGYGRLCATCNEVKHKNNYMTGKNECVRCVLNRNAEMTDMDRARIVAERMVQRLGMQFATEEDKQACIERLTWDGSRRTPQTMEIVRWEKTPPSRQG
jgi:hypothetical protein